MAGGKGTRLYPVTKVVNKHLLPVHDKPMIYYPLSTLIRLGHKIIYIITNKENIDKFKLIIKDLKKKNVKIFFRSQQKPKGIADGFKILKKEIRGKKVSLILGDNLFISNFNNLNKKINDGCTLVATRVRQPENYGVIEKKRDKVFLIKEKPKNPKSNLIATGLYFYDENLLKYLERINFSSRGELEITSLNMQYVKRKNV